MDLIGGVFGFDFFITHGKIKLLLIKLNSTASSSRINESSTLMSIALLSEILKLELFS